MSNIIKRKQFILGVQMMFGYVLLWSILFSTIPIHPFDGLYDRYLVVDILAMIVSILIIIDGYIYKQYNKISKYLRRSAFMKKIAEHRDKMFLLGSVWYIINITLIDMVSRHGILYSLFFAMTALIGILVAVRDSCIEYHANKYNI